MGHMIRWVCIYKGQRREESKSSGSKFKEKGSFKGKE
jgi:hypothetical protein